MQATKVSEVFLQPEANGLLMQQSKSWSTIKLDYLTRYLERFIVAMRGKKWRAIHYIDLFAGPGKNQINESDEIVIGSPLIALTQKRPFDRYFFSDIVVDNITALDQRCTASQQYKKVKCSVGDANEQVNTIKARIDQIDRKFISGGNSWSSLNIAFLDPFGLELKWSTVETLAQVKFMDLIIYYSQMGITREASKEIDKPVPTVIDEFFGGTEWRAIYCEYQKHDEMFYHRKLLDLYKGKLEEFGYVIREADTDEPLIRSAKRRAPLYRLLFASKHKLGNKFWNDVTRKDATGQMKLKL